MKCPEDILRKLELDGKADCMVWDDNEAEAVRKIITGFDWDNDKEYRFISIKGDYYAHAKLYVEKPVHPCKGCKLRLYVNSRNFYL